jgi:membrane associated rhomboid family serine protease
MSRAQAMLKKELGALAVETQARARLVGRSIALLWLIEAVDALVFSGGLDAYGVAPWSPAGLIGLLTMPFLHAGFGHLLANSVGIALLGWLTTARRRMDFWVVSVVSALTAGLGAWVFGAPGSVHIGASGVVFGYLGFLMGRGVWEQRFWPVLTSLLVTFTFSGMLWGMIPGLAGAGISWQGHLFGWIGGLLLARALGRARAQRRR